MSYEALALVTALTNALGVTLIARGMRGSNAVIAAFYSVAVQAGILTVILMFSSPQLNLSATGFFILGGILSLGLGRILNFVAMKGLGVAKTSALIGTSPVLTTILSISILFDEPEISTIAGAATVALGVVLVSGASGFKVERALLIGIASALSYSLSNIASKSGVLIQPDPIISAQVTALAGFIAITLYVVVTGQLKKLKISRSSFSLFSATGVLSCVGWLAMMKAMETGPVSVITTIVYSYPLFALFFTRLLVKDERISPRTMIGATLVVVGVGIVTLL